MKNKVFIITIQLFILVIIFILWEYLSSHNIINEFIFSKPSKVFFNIIDLYKNHNLIDHIFITLKESLYAFCLSIVISFFISIFFYEFPIIYKIIEPYLTVINSTPKVAIGPLIIIIFGASQKSIIINALLITLILNIITIYNGLINNDVNLSKYLDSLNTTRIQKLKFLVIPSAYKTIISSLKINISMTLIGVITGEFLVSKAGIGYLIIYGTQIFNMTIVMSGIIILLIISYMLYLIIIFIEKSLKKKGFI